jgi:hypothetical protein
MMHGKSGHGPYAPPTTRPLFRITEHFQYYIQQTLIVIYISSIIDKHPQQFNMKPTLGM